MLVSLTPVSSLVAASCDPTGPLPASTGALAHVQDVLPHASVPLAPSAHVQATVDPALQLCAEVPSPVPFESLELHAEADAKRSPPAIASTMRSGETKRETTTDLRAFMAAG